MTLNLSKNPIAIIGLSAIFPNSKNIKQYWANIINEINCITTIPEYRWKIKDYFDPDPSATDKTYSKKGGFIPEVDFDPMEFGIPPNILELTDTSQLLALIATKELLIDAGYYNCSDEYKEQIGVILGVAGGQELQGTFVNRLQYPIWEEVLKKFNIAKDKRSQIVEKIKSYYPPWKEASFPGLLSNVVSGRIANRFNLGGTNCVVDAACASSLAAIKMAVSELLENRAKIMITGGVDTDNSPFMYLCFSKTPAMTSQDSSSPFDKDSSGIIIGEGVGMIALKRLDDAILDNDKIYAVIKGIGTSSDGKTTSIYAPDKNGQKKALKRAYEDAKINPSTIGLIEAHGTGTKIGDRIEFSALNEIFKNSKEKIALGTVKSQIGHTKAAAGAASFIKSALCLYHRTLAPTINIKEADPKLNIKESSFYLNKKKEPWFSNKFPRRLGVSSFGFGGTNFHFVLEEAKTKDKYQNIFSKYKQIIIQAPSKDELLKNLENLRQNLKKQEYNKLVKQSYKLKIQDDMHRVAFVVKDKEDFLTKLNLCTDDINTNSKQGIYYSNNKAIKSNEIACLFSGQGSQYLNMGKELLFVFPQFFDNFEKVNQISDITKILYPNQSCFDDFSSFENKIKNTKNAQIAIGAFSAGLYDIFKDAGLEAKFFAGHSFGELSALYAAGVINKEDFFHLAKMRGKLMENAQKNKEASSMLAVISTLEEIQKHLDQDTFKDTNLKIANYNSQKQFVISGSKKEINFLKNSLRKNRIISKELDVSAAFHSHFVSDAAEEFAKEIKKVKFNKTTNFIYSNTTASKYPNEPQKQKEILCKQLQNPVYFKDQIEKMYENGARLFIEFGPKNILTKLCSQILKDKEHITISLNSENDDAEFCLRRAAANLAVLCVNIKPIDASISSEEETEDREKSSATIKINGANHIDTKRKEEIKNFLENDIIKDTGVSYDPVERKEEKKIIENKRSNMKEELFFKLQEEILKTHQEYIKSHNQYSKIFYEISQMQMQALTKIPNSKDLASLNQSIAFFHKQQNETLKVHHEYLKAQNKILNSSINFSTHKPNIINNFEDEKDNYDVQIDFEEKENFLISNDSKKINNQETAKDVIALQDNKEDVEIENTDLKLDKYALEKRLLEITAEKTGYPLEMIKPDMNMEADLGIDSIKKVEILGTILDEFPMLPELEADEISKLRSIKDILTHIIMDNDTQNIETENTDLKLDKYALEKRLLEITAEKTGYPLEMIKPDMNMEADLGIDSIKKVEILGTILDEFPMLPELEADEISNLKSLESIISRLAKESNENYYEEEKDAILKIDEIRSLTGLEKNEIQIFIPKLEEAKQPKTENSYLKDLPILITNDGTSKTKAIAKKLEKNKQKLIILNFPQKIIKSAIKFPKDIKQINLKDLSEGEIKKKINQVEKIGVFLHINNNQIEDKKKKEILKAIFTVAKHIPKKFKFKDKQKNLFICAISLDGQLGISGEFDSPIDAGLLGLVKSLNQEWDHTFSKVVDISSHLSDKIFAEHLYNEIYDIGKKYHEVSYFNGKRYFIAQNFDFKQVENQNKEEIPCYLVSGGAQGITSSCIVELSKKQKSKFILLGRSKFLNKKEPAWSKDIKCEKELRKKIADNLGNNNNIKEFNRLFKEISSNLKIKETLKKIEEAGSSAEYLSIDINNEKKLKKIMKKYKDKITGIIHGAGILKDKLIEEKNIDDIDMVFETKVTGLKNLLACIDKSKLQNLVIFSSAAAFFGNKGQTDYAGANEILNKMGFLFKNKNKKCNVKVFNWGPWDSGMVNEAIKKQFKERNIPIISKEMGVKLFSKFFHTQTESPQIVVGNI